jgi:Polyketide cyclase / dehydrase and lipid transport
LVQKEQKKMLRVDVVITVNRSTDDVFAFISDFENNPKWQDGMQKCTFTSPPPLGVGSTYDQEAKFLGRPILSTFKVIAYEPGRMVKATTTSSSFPITFTRMVEPEGDGARVTAVIEGDASGFFRIATPLMRWMVNRSINKDYAKLKQLLEAENK